MDGGRTILVALFLVGFGSVGTSQGGWLRAWGSNSFGQLDVPPGDDFIAVAAGMAYSLALKGDGSLVGWGKNNIGQADVPPGNDFVAIAAQWDHSVALREDGSLVAWGNPRNGAIDVPPGNDFVAVSVGVSHSLALKQDGSLAAWGSNQFAQGEVPPGNDFAAIAAGYQHSLALKQDGSLVAWGRDLIGEIDVPAGNRFVAIAAATGHNLAIEIPEPSTLVGLLSMAVCAVLIAWWRGRASNDRPIGSGQALTYAAAIGEAAAHDAVLTRPVERRAEQRETPLGELAWLREFEWVSTMPRRAEKTYAGEEAVDKLWATYRI